MSEALATDQDWTSLPGAERVTRLQADPRPAWLWSGDGRQLVWSNDAARLFGARRKGDKLKLAEPAQPIKGQISRILRMGLIGQPTLSRVQFLSGRKPLSATCQCTPLPLGEAKPHMLFVAVDPVPQDILDAADESPADIPEPNGEPHEVTAEELSQTVLPEEAEPYEADPDAAPAEEQVPQAIEEDQQAPESGVAEEDSAGTEQAERPLTGLSALVDKLARDEKLFAPLDDDSEFDEPPSGPKDVPARDFANIAYDETLEEGNEDRESDWGDEDPFAPEEAAFAADASAEGEPVRAGLWKITGRGLTSGAAPAPQETPIVQEQPAEDEPAPQEEAVVEETPESGPLDRRSRYNFEELSRILTDRVGREEPDEPSPPTAPAEPAAPAEPPKGALVTLGSEAPILNRLPLGVLIFRDQEIVFANRAMVDLTGYDDAAGLRAQGLPAVFPTIENGEPAGPVTHLLRGDGEQITVSARLQTVAWRGRSAFMLTARAEEEKNPLREEDVRSFAARMAGVTSQIFLETDKIGRITGATDHRANSDSPAPEKGMPLSALIAPSEHKALSNFLTLPARISGGERPALSLRAKHGGTLTLFAEGRAGVISGYFGILSSARKAPRPSATNLPTGELSRITRELRRPLNTIAGFSELIASEAFGPLSNPRYLEYARDIKSAGSAIGELADELDEFVRLAEGDLPLSPADIDLGELLAECLVRVRKQASVERVLLRSAISERLPMIRADAATLKQAVLNMLASAISEAGQGSKVVLSAQIEDDGAVSVHVRDTTKAPNYLAERFVVFRDSANRHEEHRQPSRSSIGLTLTRSLVAVNACTFSLDPAHETGTLMTLTIPPTLVVMP